MRATTYASSTAAALLCFLRMRKLYREFEVSHVFPATLTYGVVSVN